MKIAEFHQNKQKITHFDKKLRNLAKNLERFDLRWLKMDHCLDRDETSNKQLDSVMLNHLK